MTNMSNVIETEALLEVSKLIGDRNITKKGLDVIENMEGKKNMILFESVFNNVNQPQEIRDAALFRIILHNKLFDIFERQQHDKFEEEKDNRKSGFNRIRKELEKKGMEIVYGDTDGVIVTVPAGVIPSE